MAQEGLGLQSELPREGTSLSPVPQLPTSCSPLHPCSAPVAHGQLGAMGAGLECWIPCLTG